MSKLAFCLAAAAITAPAFAAEKPTFTKDVAPILQAKCVECHRPGDIGPMSLMTYDTARPWAKSIREKVTARIMPPFHAETGPYAFANDTRLSDDEIATIAAWVDAGAPQGDPKDMPALREFDPHGWKSGTPDLVLEPSSEYILPAGVDDEYRCYCLESNLPQDTWVSGVEYRAGNRQVVHHIMAYADPSHRSREKDKATPEPGFVCGMSGDQSTMRLDMLLGGWAPGTPPNISRDGAGMLLPANTDVVFQVHYHNTTGEDQHDRSGMGLYFSRTPIQARGRIMPVGAFQLFLPAGNAAVENHGSWTAPQDIMLGSLMPHMHYLGKSMTVDLTYPDGRSERVLSVPHYDFNWQIVYEFKEPLLLPKGTRLTMNSVHDNSADNPANPKNPPQDVRWGEATHEEMAHVWLGYIYANEHLNIKPTVPAAKQTTD